MKRPLTDAEKERIQKGIDMNQKHLDKVKDSLAYNQAILEKQQFMRDWDDKWLPYLRKKKDEEDDAAIKAIQAEIRATEKIIEIESAKIKDGVEVKNIAINNTNEKEVC
jgi:hypothetical protein